MDEILEELKDRQNRFYHESNQAIINRLMENYEAIYRQCQGPEAGDIDGLKQRLNQTDGELFTAVKQ